MIPHVYPHINLFLRSILHQFFSTFVHFSSLCALVHSPLFFAVSPWRHWLLRTKLPERTVQAAALFPAEVPRQGSLRGLPHLRIDVIQKPDGRPCVRSCVEGTACANRDPRRRSQKQASASEKSRCVPRHNSLEDLKNTAAHGGEARAARGARRAGG